VAHDQEVVSRLGIASRAGWDQPEVGDFMSTERIVWRFSSQKGLLSAFAIVARHTPDGKLWINIAPAHASFAEA